MSGAWPEMSQIHQVIVHRPGPKWQPGVNFQEQLGVEQHVGYFSGLLAAGQLFAGGPFIDSTGGMCILSAGLSKEEAEKIAIEDPTVISGLLEAEVRPWFRAMAADASA
jgi:uncharacterized protein YciI